MKYIKVTDSPLYNELTFTGTKVIGYQHNYDWNYKPKKRTRFSNFIVGVKLFFLRLRNSL